MRRGNGTQIKIRKPKSTVELLFNEFKIDIIVIKNMVMAFVIKTTCQFLLNQEGVGWILNMISDVYIVISLILTCALYIKDNLSYFLKS